VGGRLAFGAALILSLAGFVTVTLFQGIGARVPNPVEAPPPGFHDPLASPLSDAVWPIWRGDALPGWVFGHRFARTILDPLGFRPELAFAGLAALQVLASGLLVARAGRIEGSPEGP
jgi:hypothetical protein